MIAKFETAGLLSVAPWRKRKPVFVESEEFVALLVEEATMGYIQRDTFSVNCP